MSAGFFDSVALVNHNHTTTPGDGGQLSNLSVSGTIQASGAVSGTDVHATAGTVDETNTPTSAAQCPRLDQMMVFTFLTGS